MIEYEGWLDVGEANVHAVQNITTKVTCSMSMFGDFLMAETAIQVALLVLASAGFGSEFTWAVPPAVDHDSMSVQHAVRTMSECGAITILVPKWAWILPIGR
jgi:hypothetical protein